MLQSVLQAVFPSRCACCGEVLVQGERQICLNCLADLTRTLFTALDDNPAERLLAERFRLEKATAMLAFRQGNKVQQVVHAMKFHGGCDLCVEMGRQLGLELLRSGRFDDVEVLVPVPLHWTRRLMRGYNQSELLCRGISQTFGREVNSRALVRHRRTRKQSQQAGEGRERNVAGAFSVKRPEALAGRHVLLVDDVLTSGATVGSCGEALGHVPGVKVSVAVLSMAGQ